MRNVLNYVVEKIKTHILCSITFFENCAVYEVMSKNVVKPEWPQTTQMTSQHGAYELHGG